MDDPCTFGTYQKLRANVNRRQGKKLGNRTRAADSSRAPSGEVATKAEHDDLDSTKDEKGARRNARPRNPPHADVDVKIKPDRIDDKRTSQIVDKQELDVLSPHS
ncbi:hypothetical protein Tco_0985584, partial [Tanacetum coccineum]